jgi:hypothetical protein
MIAAIALLLTSLGAAAGKTGVNQGVKILEQLIGLQEEQVRLLQAIDLKVDAILAGPMNTGVRQLQDALSVGNGPDYQALLKEARSSFTAALGQDPEPLRRSFAALYLASVWLLLGYPEHFKRHLQEAHFEAFRAIIAIEHAPFSAPQRLNDMYSKVMGYKDTSPAARRHPKEQMIQLYIQDIAKARRSWGTPKERSPMFATEDPFPFKNEINNLKNERKLALQNGQQWDTLYPWDLESWLRVHAGDEP